MAEQKKDVQGLYSNTAGWADGIFHVPNVASAWEVSSWKTEKHPSAQATFCPPAMSLSIKPEIMVFLTAVWRIFHFLISFPNRKLNLKNSALRKICSNFLWIDFWLIVLWGSIFYLSFMDSRMKYLW